MTTSELRSSPKFEKFLNSLLAGNLGVETGSKSDCVRLGVG